MKSPRQLALGQFLGKSKSGALERAIGWREISAGVALLVLFVSIDRLSIGAGSINLRLELIAGGLLTLWFFVRSKGAVIQRLGIIEYALLGWLGANILSSLLFSPSTQDSLKNAGIIAGVLTIYLAGLMIFTSAQAITWAALAWVAMGAVVSILGLASAFLYILFGWTGGVNLERAYANGVFVLTPRVQSTIWEPNIFGSYSVTMGILALALSLSPEFSSSRKQRWLRFVTGCAFCGVMLSMTRTVWVIGPGLLVVMMLLSLRLHLARPGKIVRGMLIPAGVGIIVGLAVGNLMPTLRWERDNPWDLTYAQVERAVPYLVMHQAPPPDIANPGPAGSAQATATPEASSNTTGSPGPASTPTAAPVSSGSTFVDKLGELFSPGGGQSVQVRLGIFINALDGWVTHPLMGWGTGSYPLIYPPDYTQKNWIANLELHILFDTGAVGFILFFTPAVLAARRGIRTLRGSKGNWSTTHFVLLGLLVSGVGLLIAYQVTEATWLGFTWVFFALLVMSAQIAGIEGRLPEVPTYTEANAQK